MIISVNKDINEYMYIMNVFVAYEYRNNKYIKLIIDSFYLHGLLLMMLIVDILTEHIILLMLLQILLASFDIHEHTVDSPNIFNVNLLGLSFESHQRGGGDPLNGIS